MAKMGRYLQLPWLDWDAIFSYHGENGTLFSVTMAKWVVIRSVEDRNTDSYFNNFIMPLLGVLF